MPPHRGALRGGHRWPELPERIFGAVAGARASAAATEQGDDRADQTEALTDGQEHPGSTAAAAQAREFPSPIWQVLRDHGATVGVETGEETQEIPTQPEKGARCTGTDPRRFDRSSACTREQRPLKAEHFIERRRGAGVTGTSKDALQKRQTSCD